MSVRITRNKKAWGALGISLGALALMGNGCSTDANVADENLKKAAEQFEVSRRITVVNGITDKYMMVVEGKCSLEFPDNRVEIICKLKDGNFKKHHVIKSDNVFVMSEQTDGTGVDTSQYRVIFKPEALVPNFDRP
jgi:hypothetical protein